MLKIFITPAGESYVRGQGQRELDSEISSESLDVLKVLSWRKKLSLKDEGQLWPLYSRGLIDIDID